MPRPAAVAYPRRWPARSWRISAPDYRTALGDGQSKPLKGSPAASRWDPELAADMRATGRAVMEERLIPVLLNDLGST
jgi:Protein of unknown function C-terminus (DUF2399)